MAVLCGICGVTIEEGRDSKCCNVDIKIFRNHDGKETEACAGCGQVL